ncbi:MAG: hypothetical protein DDT40_00899 [candidate division WS2 bacterium]|nr:hypothetical protein [Candidatus Psychracetigena formicireducens]
MGWPRILGIQTSQTFPSDIVDWAFLRGAGKQYGILTWTNISVYNRWGWKNYMETGWHRWHGDHGPDKGPSLSLLKRLWYVSYMYGSATTGFETSYFTDEKDEQGYPKLSPIGEINVEAVKWCRKHNKGRGVQWTPVALLIDSTSGWLPPQHLYTCNTYLVWGNMDYEKGDYQIDNFFRWIYPGYEDSSYFKDERGYLTPTPFGDKFDVLTSDVQERILNQYSVVYLLGEINMTSSLITRLKEYTKKGGTLILSAEDARDFGSDFSGLSIGGRREGYGSLSLFDKKIFEEKDYIYTEVMPEKAEVLAVSEDNLPLITVNSFGKGRVVVITPDYGMTTRLKISDGGGVHPARYELLNIVKHILGEYFKDLDFTEIQGPEIQYIVNLTKDTKRILLTLVNNDREVDWEGSFSLKEGEILKIRDISPPFLEEWTGEKELLAGRYIKVTVPKGDLRVFEIIADRPLFRNK